MAAAHVVLGWSRCEDLALGRFFATPVPRRDDVIAVVQAMESAVSDDPREVSSQLGFGPRKAGRIINLVRLTRDTGDVSEDGNPEQLVEAVVARAEAHRSMERSRVEMMRAYAETQRCRSAVVLGYFGSPRRDRCGTCDNRGR